MELHMSPKVVSKGSEGRTACGSAAYRSCSCIVDNNGVIHDFSNKKGHAGGGIELPEGAPEELRDPQVLWQRHEAKDVRKDAQLNRDIEYAVPNELSNDAIIRLTKSIAKILTEKGMCVQWDIHDNFEAIKETGKPHNKHVHMMITMRDLLPDGTFGNKNRSWNKYNGGVNIADLLRPEAARLMNEELALMGSSGYVYHESFAARGIDRIPQIHVGVVAFGMEQKKIRTRKYAENEEIKRINREHISYLEKLERYRQVRERLAAALQEDMENMHASLVAQMEAAASVGESTNRNDAFKEPEAPKREEVFQEIKRCNREIYALKSDKKKMKKSLQALYLIKNLAGLPDLEQEQIEQLKWAMNYLKWAGMDDLSPKAVYEKIDELKQINIQNSVDIIRLEEAKRSLRGVSQYAERGEKQTQKQVNHRQKHTDPGDR